MQLKKKDIQIAIQTTALEMFYQQGYEKTKMSDIAKEMGMSVGNIYTYFKNKNELFYSVFPEETIFYFEDIILTTMKAYNDFLVNKEGSEEVFELISRQMLLITGRYREIVIMLDKSEGTVYEGMKERLIDEMSADRLSKGHLYSKMTNEELLIFYKIIGHGFLEMVLMGLKETASSEEERYSLCMSLIAYQLRKKEA